MLVYFSLGHYLHRYMALMSIPMIWSHWYSFTHLLRQQQEQLLIDQRFKLNPTCWAPQCPHSQYTML